MKKNIILVSLIFMFFMAAYSYAAFDKIKAVVNDAIITQNDINQQLSVLYMELSNQFKGNELEQKLAELQKDILNQLIEDKLIAQEAKLHGIEVSDTEIEQRLGEI